MISVPCKCYYCDYEEIRRCLKEPILSAVSCDKHSGMYITTWHRKSMRVDSIKITSSLGVAYPIMYIDFIRGRKRQLLFLEPGDGTEIKFDPGNALNKFRTILTFQ